MMDWVWEVLTTLLLDDGDADSGGSGWVGIGWWLTRYVAGG